MAPLPEFNLQGVLLDVVPVCRSRGSVHFVLLLCAQHRTHTHTHTHTVRRGSTHTHTHTQGSRSRSVVKTEILPKKLSNTIPLFPESPSRPTINHQLPCLLLPFVVHFASGRRLGEFESLGASRSLGASEVATSAGTEASRAAAGCVAFIRY